MKLHEFVQLFQLALLWMILANTEKDNIYLRVLFHAFAIMSSILAFVILSK